MKNNTDIKQYRKDVGNKLNYYRRQKGLTQQQVADILMICRTTYTKYETGVISPNLDTLIKLADIFSVELDKLFSVNEGDWYVKVYWFF